MFVLRLFQMTANQSDPGLNRGLLSNFWLLRSENHVKFKAECGMFMMKHVLVKDIFTNGLNIGLCSSRKMFMEWKQNEERKSSEQSCQ